MSVSFRNVDVDPTASPDQWPFEAVLTALERGSLSDWHKLASAIRRWPWGPCAQAVQTIVSWGEHWGVDAVFADLIADARHDADQEAARAFGRRCHEVRTRLGLTMREFAPMLGTSASRLSTYESGAVAPSIAVAARLDRVALLTVAKHR